MGDSATVSPVFEMLIMGNFKYGAILIRDVLNLKAFLS